MKYIPAEKLIAEIERRKNRTERRLDNIVSPKRKDTIDEEQLVKIELRHKVDKAYLNGVWITLSDILSFITSLQQEQQGVDLDFQVFAKEMDAVFNLPEEVTENTEEDPLNWEYAIARHFYELGLNARKED